MEFHEAIKSGLRKYATFSGRASRSEMWFFILFISLITGGFKILDNAFFPTTNKGMMNFFTPLYTISLMAFIIPRISVAIRRLHDTDRSGWWFWIALIPLVGGIVLLVWYCTKGTTGDNRFGPDPLAPAA